MCHPCFVAVCDARACPCAIGSPMVSCVYVFSSAVFDAPHAPCSIHCNTFVLLMEVCIQAIGDPMMLFRPCIDCGQFTGRFCDGRAPPGHLGTQAFCCFAQDRMPDEVWAESQLTPFCSACEKRHQVCHRCRRTPWRCRPCWMPTRACIECGSMTGSWCPGLDGQGFSCRAEQDVSQDLWNGHSLTAFCTACTSRSKVCRHCRVAG